MGSEQSDHTTACQCPACVSFRSNANGATDLWLPTVPGTITIPVAEYEDLKKRAFTVEEVEDLIMLVCQSEEDDKQPSYDPLECWQKRQALRDSFLTKLTKLTAAIKEQEG